MKSRLSEAVRNFAGVPWALFGLAFLLDGLVEQNVGRIVAGLIGLLLGAAFIRRLFAKKSD